VRGYYEELWERLPANARPEQFALRRDFVLSQLTAEDRVLDVGCGSGEFTATIADLGGAVVGVDVAESALKRAREGHPDLDFVRVEIDQPLPFEDNSFDVVWAGEVIEHIADTAPWLSELRRVLVPRGRLLLSTPNHSRLRIALGGIERFSPPLGDHLHLYSRRSLRELLEEFGFDHVEVRPGGGPPLIKGTLLARATR
jgi:2-polyprenyl-3-methyl-5-hydroxy-6-metoxy-1,4-benzoquinol methylase